MFLRFARSMRSSPLVVAILASLLTAALLSVGMAIAADDGDTFYACARPSGRVRAGTIRVNVEPTCPARQTLVSWQDGGPLGELAVEARTTATTVPTGHHAPSVQCEDDEAVTGGGVTVGSIGFNDKIFGSSPHENGWLAQIFNDTAFDLDVWVTAMCAKIVAPAP